MIRGVLLPLRLETSTCSEAAIIIDVRSYVVRMGWSPLRLLLSTLHDVRNSDSVNWYAQDHDADSHQKVT
jgi:hypothetical protein